MQKQFRKRNQGNLVVIVMIGLLAFALIGGTGYIVFKSKNKKSTTTTTPNVTNSTNESPATSNTITNDTNASESVPTTQITDIELILKVSGDEKKLPSVTSSSFVSYMKTKLDGFQCDFTEFPEGGYYVSKISTNFVKGSVGCGGGAAITWYFEANEWHEFGYQSYVPCKDLVAHKIPSDFVSDCYDEAKPEAVLNNPNGPL